MFARLTMVDGSPENIEKGIESFQQNVLPTAQSLDGYKGAMFFVDRASGKVMGMTLWGSEGERAAAGEELDAARQKTLQALGASAPPVSEFEVAVADLRA